MNKIFDVVIRNEILARDHEEATKTTLEDALKQLNQGKSYPIRFSTEVVSEMSGDSAAMSQSFGHVLLDQGKRAELDALVMKLYSLVAPENKVEAKKLLGGVATINDYLSNRG